MLENRLFGQTAIRLGLVTEAEVVLALERQRRLGELGQGHVLLGRCFIELGVLTDQQVFDVLRASVVPASPRR